MAKELFSSSVSPIYDVRLCVCSLRTDAIEVAKEPRAIAVKVEPPLRKAEKERVHLHGKILI